MPDLFIDWLIYNSSDVLILFKLSSKNWLIKEGSQQLCHFGRLQTKPWLIEFVQPWLIEFLRPYILPLQKKKKKKRKKDMIIDMNIIGVVHKSS